MARPGRDKNLLVMLLGNLLGYLAAIDDDAGAATAAREGIAINASREPDRVDVAIALEHMALVSALRGDLARAATLEGYAGAAFARHGYEREFTETTTHDRLTELLREGLPPADSRDLRPMARRSHPTRRSPSP